MPKEKKNAKRPNYSFDQWIKSTQELGDTVASIIEKGKADEKKTDDEAAKKQADHKKQLEKDELDKKEKSNLNKFKSLSKDNPMKGKKWEDFKKKKDMKEEKSKKK